MPPTKRQKRSHIESHETESDSWGTLSASEMSNSVKGRQSPDTEDEIAGARLTKSKKTLKRKHRATDPSNFGASLQTLLKTDAPSGLPLSLKPSAARRHNDEKLELKAKKLLKGERKSKEEVGRIRDVIGGWGGEGERTLRKVAQRGVVKLFNAIQQSQASAAVAEKETKNARGTGKPTLPAPSFNQKSKTGKGKNKDNSLGRGKASLDKDNFMDMIRSGGLVSRS
ncbi:Rrp15p-domain-containing protein [Russula ochroleuca]|uniref:Rrp15p-domain-containing protein n=1 Tax=Russula ochroleuca TaxID=152965 RepID=A0A9P5MXW0_9AGAM|nr:Rrp15p-domain-containing protein [Russula ochroleuca]